MIRPLLALAVLGAISAIAAPSPKSPQGQSLPFVVRKAVLPLRTLPGSMRGVKAIAFSPDDKTLFSAGDKEIHVWDATSGAAKPALVGHAKNTSAVAISPDGKKIASSGEEGALILWDSGSGKILTQHPGNNYALRNLAFSAQGDKLLGSRAAFASLFDAGTGEEVGPVLGHATALASLAWSPDNKFIAAGGNAWPDERITLAVWEISPMGEAGQGLAYNSPNVHKMTGKFSIGASRARLNQHVKYFRDLKESNQQVLVCVGFAADSDTLAIAWGKQVVFHAMTTDKDTRSFPIPAEISDTRAPLRCISLSPNGKLLAVVRANSVQIWNIETAQLVARFLEHIDDVDCLTFSHDGKVLATGSADKTIKLWDMTAY